MFIQKDSSGELILTVSPAGHPQNYQKYSKYTISNVFDNFDNFGGKFSSKRKTQPTLQGKSFSRCHSQSWPQSAGIIPPI